MEHICLYTVVIASLILSVATALCPPVCTCDNDGLGRKRVRCEGDSVSIPGTLYIQSLDADVKVLIMTGSEQNRNHSDVQPFMFFNKSFQEIHLSFVSLTRVPPHLFVYMSDTLQVLNLTHNSIEAVTDQTFRNLSRLTHLHLDYNRISRVHGMFDYLSSLKVLTMSNNLIREFLPRIYVTLCTFEVLDLSSNPLGERQPGAPINETRQPIPEAVFQNMPNLRMLLLANTSLNGLPWKAHHKSLLNLQAIDLSNNRIKKIEAEQLSLISRLQVIRLDGNPITSIEVNAFSGLDLQSLNLSGINSSALFTGIFQRTNITFLDVSNMGLKALNPEVFAPIAQDLEQLNINGNPGIRLDPQMFQMYPSLEELSLEMTNTTDLSNLFVGYPDGPKKVRLPGYQLVPAAWRCINPISVTCHIIWPLVSIPDQSKNMTNVRLRSDAIG